MRNCVSRATLFSAALLLSACTPNEKMVSTLGTSVFGETRIIWDDDTRQDVENVVEDPLAAATAVLFYKHQVTPTEEQGFLIPQSPLSWHYPLCEDEKFRDQEVLGHCSGVLIGPRTVLTAAHCFSEPDNCDNIHITFGRNNSKAVEQRLEPGEVYTCDKIVKYVKTRKHDYAVIQLDRDVSQAVPVAVGRSLSLRTGDPVLSYSYPLGLPLKKDLGEVLKNNPFMNFFLVKVDTFSGSSGSPLFNTNRELVGILVSGSDDFNETKDEIRQSLSEGRCINSMRCKDGPCRGEHFMKIEAMGI